MKFLLRNKYHFIAFFSIVLLFILSVFVRKENMSVPMSRHHEWITAHTLITCDIWNENGGPSAYHFSPVYSYPGEGNAYRKRLGGIVDNSGDVYYVSYPPFAFLFAYYATQVMGGPSVDAIRNLNLSLHLLSAFFIYLIAVALSNDEQKKNLSIAGLVGAFLYLFSAGNLWILGNLYFADMLVQFFIIAAIYFSIRFFKKEYKHEMLFLSILFFVFFLAVYTEWLGLFLSFFLGLSFLIAFLVKREIRFLKGFIVLGIAAALAIGLTIAQYSSIAGWDELKRVSTEKYQERSGHAPQDETPNAFNIENSEAFDFLMEKVNVNYAMAEFILGVVFLLFILSILFRKMRRAVVNFYTHIIIFIVVCVTVMSHYYLFFNFNALHDFSSLKTGFLFILTTVILVVLLEQIFTLPLKLGLAVLLLILCIVKGFESITIYTTENSITDVNWNQYETGKQMQKLGEPEKGIFTNISFSPELVYYSKHAIFPLQDTVVILPMMGYFKNTQGQYYHHEQAKLLYMVEFAVVNDSIVYDYKNRINFKK